MRNERLTDNFVHLVVEQNKRTSRLVFHIKMFWFPVFCKLGLIENMNAWKRRWGICTNEETVRSNWMKMQTKKL